VSDPERAAHALTSLAQAGITVTDFSLGQPSLDEVFLALTGQPVEDETDLAEERV
jgi:ABC-2 type transport system ATP-binding protein